MNEYTSNDYSRVLCRLGLYPHQRRMLEVHYHAPEQTITAPQMARAMGYRNHGGANIHYGTLAKTVGESLGWQPLPRPNLKVLALLNKRGRELHWTLRPQIADALELLGWIEGEQHVIPEEVDNVSSFHEGAAKEIRVNAYERSSVAREQCILHHGCECAACGIVLANVYGEAALGYIHVHHLRQLSEVSESYQVDPIHDLVPVCPNCHAVIHLRKPPYSIKEVKALIGDRENANIAATGDGEKARRS